MNRSFLLWSLAPFDSGRCFRGEVLRVIEPSGGQVALKESAQVIGSTVEPELNCAPVDGMFHFPWAGKR